MKTENRSFPAMCGGDFIRDTDWKPMRKTRKGWQRYADKLARKHSQRDNFQWFGKVSWIEWRDCYRVNIAGDFRL